MIIQERSKRIELFYNTLKKEIPEIPKDSIIYFGIQDNNEARSWFRYAFSVAEMPNTTAIAWRYGIDRYDFKMFTEFSELINELKENPVSLDKIYTFWLTKNQLVNTSEEFRNLAENYEANFPQTGFPIIALSSFNTENQTTQVSANDVVIDFPEPIGSLLPTEITFSISAEPVDTSNVTFPLVFNQVNNPVYTDSTLQGLAFRYQLRKNAVLKNAKYSASSEWQERTTGNIHDSNPDTIWQADRIKWHKEDTNLVIDINNIQEISGLAWIGGHTNNMPTRYMVEVSTDGKEWNLASLVSNAKRVESKDPQIVKFNSPQEAKFLRVSIAETLGGDSPQIAETWPIFSEFAETDVNDLEKFANRPFEYITDRQAFVRTLFATNRTGNIRVYWLGDKSENWLTGNDNLIQITYDGLERRYKLIIPANGTQVYKVKLSEPTIPGKIAITGVQTRSMTLQEIVPR